MKKVYFRAGVILTLAASLGLTSCIGSFSLSNKLLSWNNQIGDKFVNELVFFAFWVLPVYEVSVLADVLVLNSIEFWSGDNPVASYKKVVEGENGKYLVECDGKGYTITSEDGNVTRLNFNADTRSWSAVVDGKEVTFMTFVDDTHVRMLDAKGEYQTVEISADGVVAYQAVLGTQTMMASK